MEQRAWQRQLEIQTKGLPPVWQLEQERQSATARYQNSSHDEAESERTRITHDSNKCRNPTSADYIANRYGKAHRQIARFRPSNRGQYGKRGGKEPDGQQGLKQDNGINPGVRSQSE